MGLRAVGVDSMLNVYFSLYAMTALGTYSPLDKGRSATKGVGLASYSPSYNPIFLACSEGETGSPKDEVAHECVLN